MIKKNIKFLDLSENPMFSAKFYNKLADLIQNPEFQIEKLFLEGNKMQDDQCRIICDHLQEKQSLQVLNLNNN